MTDTERALTGLQNLRDAILNDYIRETDQAIGTIDDAIELLKEQQPKTGHWIEHEGLNDDKYYDCSICDCSLREIHRGMGFCPYCGAKMDNPL